MVFTVLNHSVGSREGKWMETKEVGGNKEEVAKSCAEGSSKCKAGG